MYVCKTDELGAGLDKRDEKMQGAEEELDELLQCGAEKCAWIYGFFPLPTFQERARALLFCSRDMTERLTVARSFCSSRLGQQVQSLGTNEVEEATSIIHYYCAAS